MRTHGACAALQVDCRKVLWELLVLMAKHQGQLKVSYSPSASASKAAAGLLRGAVTAAAGAAVSAATAATTTAADADSRGGSNAGTPKAGAIGIGLPAPGASASGPADGGTGNSELLKVLTPGLGSAPGPANGMRILSHQVPEMELQATATEMQVRLYADVGVFLLGTGDSSFHWGLLVQDRLMKCAAAWLCHGFIKLP